MEYIYSEQLDDVNRRASCSLRGDAKTRDSTYEAKSDGRLLPCAGGDPLFVAASQ